MHTIVIAPNSRIAMSVASYHALQKVGSVRLTAGSDRLIDFSTGEIWDAAPSFRALRCLEGARPTEIVIVDYMGWHTLRPGVITDLWYQIQRLRALYGTRVVWQ